MNEKLLAGFVTAAAIAPVCAVCVFGPTFIGGALGWLSGWFGGLGPAAAMVLAVIAALAVYGLLRWKKSKARPRKEISHQVQYSEDDAVR